MTCLAIHGHSPPPTQTAQKLFNTPTTTNFPCNHSIFSTFARRYATSCQDSEFRTHPIMRITLGSDFSKVRPCGRLSSIIPFTGNSIQESHFLVHFVPSLFTSFSPQTGIAPPLTSPREIIDGSIRCPALAILTKAIDWSSPPCQPHN